MNALTFIHRFRNGTIARLTLTIERGAIIEMRCSWQPEIPRPKVLRRLLPEYRAWRDAAVSHAIAQHGLKPMLIIDK